ncbi:hypothetical protein AVEN_85769-1 [Araneus ventricosus]|uniref:Uncharacterized protein n=2 Tax=Araneus ventricosus TaxID=182803 RepID=A0A4Y2WMY4_ARAVE|nr:hypothetical protein AVEN_85769-1 [Araneus ventricosus]
MAELVNDPKIVSPFLPSLLHFASVKVAIQLLNNFDIETLNTAFTEIKHGNSSSSKEGGNSRSFKEGGQDNYEAMKAKEHLLFIPAHLREKVLETVKGLNYSLWRWQKDHSKIISLEDIECTLYWRSDGTINAVKAAEQLVLDESIDITTRFEIACMYCFEKSVKNLWVEMQASRVTYITADNSAARFWIRWMRDGSRVPWTRAILEYVEPFRIRNLRFSCFFHLLQPKDRQKFLYSLQFAAEDDFRFCLFSMTKEEEEEMLASEATRFFLLHLGWPLQSLFLQTVEKTWNFIGNGLFEFLFDIISNYNIIWQDFDYHKLYQDFWNRSPNRLKESTEERPCFKKRIDVYFVKIRRKRKVDKQTD